MISRKWWSLVLPVLLAGCLAAQNPPAAAELTQLLHEFLAGAGASNAAMHERFWAEDLIYTSSSGRRMGKADILHEVKAAPAPQPDDPKVTYDAEEIRIQQYGETAVAAFRLVGRTEKNGKTEVARYLNTGTFVRRNGTWRAVAWQATRIPDEAQK